MLPVCMNFWTAIRTIPEPGQRATFIKKSYINYALTLKRIDGMRIHYTFQSEGLKYTHHNISYGILFVDERKKLMIKQTIMDKDKNYTDFSYSEMMRIIFQYSKVDVT